MVESWNSNSVFLFYSNAENTPKLGGGFKYFLFSPLLEEIIQFDEYFSDGLKPPTRKDESKELPKSQGSHHFGGTFFCISIPDSQVLYNIGCIFIVLGVAQHLANWSCWVQGGWGT